MSEHTPGPWFYRTKLSRSENHRGFTIDDSAGWVADVSPRDKDGIEGEANARLIICAPKLLAALKALEELWGWMPFDSGADIQETAERLAKQAREAIREAKGQ